MNTATKKPTPIRHTLTFEVDVDADFVDYLTQYNDIFMTSRAGYWAFGHALPKRDATVGAAHAGWLVFECLRSSSGMPSEKNIARALDCWKTGETLPKGWHLLDRDAAIRAWCEGVKRWGVEWYEEVDVDREDTVVQLSLLGEVRYS